MANPPPTPVTKKSGMGCLGCGCLILVLLLVLFLGAVGGIGYLAYSRIVALTSPTPTTIQTFDAGDDAYAATKQKMTAFTHDLNQHQPASLHLNGNEINTLIAHEPNFSKNNIQLFVTIENDHARLQTCIPTGIITWGWIKNRYLNGDVTFGMHFDSSMRQVDLSVQSLQFNGQDIPKANLPAIDNAIDPAFNQVLQNDPTFALILQQAKTVEIKDGELVIETQ